MFKNLFEQIYRLIFSPQKSWNKYAAEKETKITDNDSFFKTYLYPVVGIVALLTFIGVIFHKREFDVQLALKLTIKASIALFAGFYLASFLLNKVMERFFSVENSDRQFFSTDDNFKLHQRFAGYSSALIYAMYMILGIFPDFGFLKVILLYTFYMIWEGSAIYMQIPDSQRSKFTIAATLIVLLSPEIIEKMMYLTMPGMRF